MLLLLNRTFQDNRVTLGELTVADDPDQFKFYTLERPWLNNAKNKSCIPDGTYQCKKDIYYGGDGPGGKKKDYPSYLIMNVPGRTQIKIHKGNYVKDVVGCVALGSSMDIKKPAVWSSAIAYNKFMQSMTDVDVFELKIETNV